MASGGPVVRVRGLGATTHVFVGGFSGCGRSAHCRRCCCSHWASWRCRCSTWRWGSPTPSARGSRVVLARTQSSVGCATRCRLCLNCARKDCCLLRAHHAGFCHLLHLCLCGFWGAYLCEKGGVELVCSYGPRDPLVTWTQGYCPTAGLLGARTVLQPDPLGSRLLL